VNFSCRNIKKKELKNEEKIKIWNQYDNVIIIISIGKRLDQNNGIKPTTKEKECEKKFDWYYIVF